MYFEHYLLQFYYVELGLMVPAYLDLYVLYASQDRTSSQPTNLKRDVSIPVPPVPFLMSVGNIVLMINKWEITGVKRE